MKVLLLSVTAGQGHHQCGKALMNALEKEGALCQMIDTLKYINPVLSEGVAQGYLLSTKNIPKAYGRVYRLAELHKTPSSSTSPMRLPPHMMAAKLKKYIDAFCPDVIVCTHVFSAQVITAMKDLHAKTVGIITDFTIHPFWEETELDCYITASEALNIQATKKAIPLSRVHPLGIPIDGKFAVKGNKAEARAQLGLENKTTVLVMSGSMGFGNISKVISQIDSLPIDFQIVAVCGNNTKMKESIDEYGSSKKIYCYGYVDNVDKIMDASDVIITKPGGLTSSEAMAKGLPMVLVNPIPGQEDRNVEFLLNCGVAMSTSKTFPVDECLYTLLSAHGRMEDMARCASRIGKPNAAADLARLCMEMGQ